MHVDALSVLSLLSAAPFGLIAAILGFHQIRRTKWVRKTRTGRRLFGVQPSAVGLGMAFLFTPINVMAFYFIRKEKMNNATGIINLARNIGGSVGIANVTTMLSRRAQVHQAMLVSHLTPLDPAYTASLSGATHFLMSQGSNPAQAMNQAHGLIYGNLVRQASMMAYIDSFWLLGLTFLAMIPFMFLMKRIQLRGTPAAPAHCPS